MIKDILRQVKENKKYKTLSDEIVKNEIKKYLIFEKINESEINKEDIKNIRARLHRSYSSFQTKKKNKRYFYLNNLKQILETKNPSKKDLSNLDKINKYLLSITLSTKERLEDYEDIYKKIFEITNIPETIVDLGSGLNPLSYPCMRIKKLIYFSYDIDEGDMKFLNEYFKTMQVCGLSGKAGILDLRNLEILNLPESDIIFLFKIIDIINESEKNFKASEELIKNLIKKTKYIVASFATRTITRKKMNYPNRKWFELMLTRNNFNFKIIRTDNEIFYVIKIIKFFSPSLIF